MPRPVKTLEPKPLYSFLGVIVSIVLLAQFCIVDFNSPMNTEAAPAWAITMSHTQYTISVIGFWLGVVLFLTSVTLLVKRGKNL